jgi:hypothetical protein
MEGPSGGRARTPEVHHLASAFEAQATLRAAPASPPTAASTSSAAQAAQAHAASPSPRRSHHSRPHHSHTMPSDAARHRRRAGSNAAQGDGSAGEGRAPSPLLPRAASALAPSLPPSSSWAVSSARQPLHRRSTGPRVPPGAARSPSLCLSPPSSILSGGPSPPRARWRSHSVVGAGSGGVPPLDSPALAAAAAATPGGRLPSRDCEGAQAPPSHHSHHSYPSACDRFGAAPRTAAPEPRQ